MVIHVVLYRPKSNLDKSLRSALIQAVSRAREEIPQVRRFLVGKRLLRAAPYETGVAPDFPWVAVVEFTDREGLEAYLAHPGHDQLGRLFRDTVEASFVYDYEVVDATALGAIVEE